jgi:gamma-glutamyltranspeptidase / glutathione hydrolase
VGGPIALSPDMEFSLALLTMKTMREAAEAVHQRATTGASRGRRRARRCGSWLTMLPLLWLMGCTLAPSPVLPMPSPSPTVATQRPAAAAEPRPPAAPEIAGTWVDKPGWTYAQVAVAAANPLAAEAGVQMLRAGGAAIDAAVAVQMVLALVEPQSSGVGGGAFLLHWDGARLEAWDGRETAPGAADERLFLQPDGRPMDLELAAVGGRAVGTPGVVMMLEQAHRRHGQLPWAQLIQPAIELADQGFEVSPRLHALLRAETALRRDAQAGAYFYRADGQPHPVGHRLRNPALAQVLRAIAAQGSAALHRGAVARDIAERVQGHAGNPGRLTTADLADYQVKRREPMCTDWLTHYRVCGMPPPSSGHLAVMQMLGMLERLPVTSADTSAPASGVPGPDWLHVYIEAARLAFADRGQYVADPDFVASPAGGWQSLLDDGYLRQRAALIGTRAMKQALPGQTAGARSAWAPQPAQVEHGTSHISIVDGEGRGLAMTTSIEAAWGSRIMSDGGSGLAGGFLLNNQLTDFSLAPTDAAGRPIANRLQPGKRPRSSMSPTLVFDRRDGRLIASLGSPGGAAIIHYTAKALLGIFDWGLDAQRAVDAPNFGSFENVAVLERGRFPAATLAALRARGHVVVETDLTSGAQVLRRTPEGWSGAADPRREGVVLGR